MSVRVDATRAIDGLSKLVNGIPKASATSRRVAAESGVNGAKQRVHVITGNLRNSIRIISETQDITRFGSEIRYAGIEEFRPGHSYLMAEYNRMHTFYPELFMRNLRTFF